MWPDWLAPVLAISAALFGLWRLALPASLLLLRRLLLAPALALLRGGSPRRLLRGCGGTSWAAVAGRDSPLLRAYARQLAGDGYNLMLLMLAPDDGEMEAAALHLAEEIRCQHRVQVRIVANWSAVRLQDADLACFVCCHSPASAPSADGISAGRDAAAGMLGRGRIGAIVHAAAAAATSVAEAEPVPPLDDAAAAFLRHLCLCLADEAVAAGAPRLLTQAALPSAAGATSAAGAADFVRRSLDLLGVESVTTGRLAGDLAAALALPPWLLAAR